MVELFNGTPFKSFRNYNQHLLPLGEQLTKLKLLNQKLPKDLRIPKKWFRNIDTKNWHKQSVKSLRFIYVVLDSYEKTFRLSWRMIELTQPNAKPYVFYGISEHMIRLDSTTQEHGPGIYIVTINLVDNWKPDKKQSVDQVRNIMNKKNKKLAGFEVIQACALQKPSLLQSQDGINFPYFNLAGLQYCDDLCLNVDTIHLEQYKSLNGIYLGAWETDHQDQRYSSPTVK